jgi:hypothetical protein
MAGRSKQSGGPGSANITIVRMGPEGNDTNLLVRTEPKWPLVAVEVVSA